MNIELSTKLKKKNQFCFNFLYDIFKSIYIKEIVIKLVTTKWYDVVDESAFTLSKSLEFEFWE